MDKDQTMLQMSEAIGWLFIVAIWVGNKDANLHLNARMQRDMHHFHCAINFEPKTTWNSESLKFYQLL